MSASDEVGPSSAREEAQGSAPPPPVPPPVRSRNAVCLWAGLLVIVLVGAVALGLSLSSVAERCASNPTGLPLPSSAVCGNNLVSGAIEAVVAAAAFVMGGVLLLFRARIASVHRIPLAAGILVAIVLIVAAVPALVPRPAATIVAHPELDFPMAADTTFTATPGAFDAFVETAIPADPYVPWALIELQGAWQATSVVCLAVTRAEGSRLGTTLGVVCGTAVSFVFVLDATTYVFAFYVPSENNPAVPTQVVITSDVHIVY